MQSTGVVVGDDVVGDLVEDLVGELVGDAVVGELVGKLVGEILVVGVDDEALVGNAVGTAVGFLVGAADTVGALVDGLADGDEVTSGDVTVTSQPAKSSAAFCARNAFGSQLSGIQRGARMVTVASIPQMMSCLADMRVPPAAVQLFMRSLKPSTL